MNNNDPVFEYLIDQLRQQVNNSQCEDLVHEVQSLRSELARYKKPYIAYVKKTDWVQGDSRFLKKWGKHRADILRECIQEQDAELQSLKNQLRDASEQIKELREDNIKKSEHISHLTVQVKELHLALVKATGDAEAYKLIRKGGYISEGQSCVVGEHGPEQSGRRKDDTHECYHNWRFVNGKAPAVCINCGVAKSSECEHEWQFYGVGFPCMCIKCGLKK